MKGWQCSEPTARQTQPLCDYNKHQLQYNEPETVMAVTVIEVMLSIKKSTQCLHVCYNKL